MHHIFPRRSYRFLENYLRLWQAGYLGNATYLSSPGQVKKVIRIIHFRIKYRLKPAD